jgi:hypothetical protein
VTLKMKGIMTIAIICIMISFNTFAANVGVGIKGGTLGMGGEFTVSLSDTINARVSITEYELGRETDTITIGDSGATGLVNSTLDVDIGGNALLFDWYVFDGIFHLTAGLVKNTGEVRLTGVLNNDIVVNGQALSVSDITNGSMTGVVSLGDSYEPYLGIGWGRKASAEAGFSFSAEIGVTLLEPSTQLSGIVNVLGTNNLTQAELDTRLQGAQDDVDKELDEFEIWPVLSIGLNYAF